MTSSELNELKEAFDMFDTEGTGKISTIQLKNAMGTLNFEKKSPVVFEIIC